MAVYSKETALFDKGAISTDIKEAEKVATNYIMTHTDNASYFHAEGNFNPATGNSVKITDQIDIVRNGESVIAIGETNEETGNDIIRIGNEEETRAEIDYHSLKLIDKEDRTYFWVSDLRDEDGLATMTDYFIGDGISNAFVLDNNVVETISVSDSSHSDNTYTTALLYTKSSTFIEGRTYYTLTATQVTNPVKKDFPFYYLRTTYSDWPSVTAYSKASPPFDSRVTDYYTVTGTLVTSPREEDLATYYSGATKVFIFNTTPSANANITIKYKTDYQTTKAYTLGIRKTDSGLGGYSVAEGQNNIASAMDSHAEGGNNKAIAIGAHAEGVLNVASGSYSHAEGSSNKALQYASHAEGHHTIAGSYAQHVGGKYNIEDSNDKYAVIIGNGSSTDRSNALALAWTGDVTLKNHDSAIGTIKNEWLKANKTVPTSKGTALCSIVLSPGTWIVDCGARSPKNASGVRRANLSNTSGAEDCQIQVGAASANDVVQLRFISILTVSESATLAQRTFYLNVWQNSGGQLIYPSTGSGYGNYIRAIRIV